MQKIGLLLFASASLFASLPEAAEDVIHAGVVLTEARLSPATAGNFSRRVTENFCKCELKFRMIKG